MSERPNVIVFFTDQQRWDTSGLHGNPLDLTPNLTAWQRAETHIANSFTCQPVCGPARSCLQTGLYATTTGCFRNGIPSAGRLRNARDAVQRRRLQHGLHRQMASKRPRRGGRRPRVQTVRIRLLARLQCAGVHLLAL